MQYSTIHEKKKEICAGHWGDFAAISLLKLSADCCDRIKPCFLLDQIRSVMSSV